jgi:hypothetical protein
MRVMKKQATKKVSTTKLPDDNYTKNGELTLKELFRVHFPDSKSFDDSVDERCQQNMDVCGYITNRGYWNLAGHVINQNSDGN